MEPNIEGLYHLITIAEEMLFSFPLPSDLVKKYEYLRDQTYQKAGIDDCSSKLWALQSEAHAKAKFKTPRPDPLEMDLRDTDYRHILEISRKTTVNFSQLLESSNQLFEKIKEKLISIIENFGLDPKQSNFIDFFIRISKLDMDSYSTSWILLENEAEKCIQKFSRKLNDHETIIFELINKAAEQFRHKKDSDIDSLFEERLKAINESFSKERKQIEAKFKEILTAEDQNDLENTIKIKNYYAEKCESLARESTQIK